MTTDKLLRMKTVTNILLIISVILFLIALGVTYGPALFKDAQMNQDNQEYIELSEQNSHAPDENEKLLPNTDRNAVQDTLPDTSPDALVEPELDTPAIPVTDLLQDSTLSDSTEDSTTDTPATNRDTGSATLPDLSALKAQNKDFVAWLKVPGTKIDYPVVQSDNIDYYLTHTFEGTKSSLGTLFSLGNADYSGGRNIAIYGHHITGSGEKMFKPLLNYKDKSFWNGHQTITLDTLNGSRTYRVFAVINMEQDEWDPSTATFADTEAFAAFIVRAREQALYDTGVNVSANDRILTLITCDRSFAGKDGRLIVMAVQQ